MSRLRWPWLTLAVAAATLAVIAAQTLHPPLVQAWQWDAARVGKGELWRLLTGALIHTNGPAQITFNLLGLLLIGWLVEQSWSRLAWVVGAAAGLAAGEIAAVFWYPVGGGASVVLGGLVGLAMAGWTIDTNLPAWFRFGVPALYLLGAVHVTMTGNIHGPPVIAGATIGFLLLGMRRPVSLLTFNG